MSKPKQYNDFDIFGWIRAVDNAQLSTGARSLALALIPRMNSSSGNVVKTTMEELARHLGKTRDTVTRWRLELERLGLLESDRKQQGNVYVACLTGPTFHVLPIRRPMSDPSDIPCKAGNTCAQSHVLPIRRPMSDPSDIPPAPPYKESAFLSTPIRESGLDPAYTREGSAKRTSVEPSKPHRSVRQSSGVSSSPLHPSASSVASASAPKPPAHGLGGIEERHRPNVCGRAPNPATDPAQFIKRLEEARGEACRTTLRNWLTAVAVYLDEHEQNELLHVATTQMNVASRPFLKSVVERICAPQSQPRQRTEPKRQPYSALRRYQPLSDSKDSSKTSTERPPWDLTGLFESRVVDLSQERKMAISERQKISTQKPSQNTSQEHTSDADLLDQVLNGMAESYDEESASFTQDLGGEE